MADENSSVMTLPTDMVGHFSQSEASTIVDGLRAGHDAQFDAAYLSLSHPDHSRAKAIWEKLHSTAFPPQELADKNTPKYERSKTDTAVVQHAQAAQAEIATLKADPAFYRRLMARDPSAVDRWNELHAAGYPGDMSTDASTEDDTPVPDDIAALVDKRPVDPSLPLKYRCPMTYDDAAAIRAMMKPEEIAANPDFARLEVEGVLPERDMTPEEIREFNSSAVADVAMLEDAGLPRNVAVANIGLIKQSIEMRQGRVMDVGEKAVFDKILQDKWGTNYDTRLMAAAEAMDRMKLGDDLGWNLERCDPHTAACVADLLSQTKATDK